MCGAVAGVSEIQPGDVESEPPATCSLCPRLVAFRDSNRRMQSGWHNAPVPSVGTCDARVLIVGLAPGLKGANRTGRPFTGDYAGDTLHRTLIEFGFASGIFRSSPDDDLRLHDSMITNAVRCVPPHNKPMPAEIAQCRTFLKARIASLPRLRVILALGRIAHDSTLKALGCGLSDYPFAHGIKHSVRPRLALFDSYHCSRYNTNTGRLTPAMFKSVLHRIRSEIDD